MAKIENSNIKFFRAYLTDRLPDPGRELRACWLDPCIQSMGEPSCRFLQQCRCHWGSQRSRRWPWPLVPSAGIIREVVHWPKFQIGKLLYQLLTLSTPAAHPAGSSLTSQTKAFRTSFSASISSGVVRNVPSLVMYSLQAVQSIWTIMFTFYPTQIRKCNFCQTNLCRSSSDASDENDKCGLHVWTCWISGDLLFPFDRCPERSNHRLL